MFSLHQLPRYSIALTDFQINENSYSKLMAISKSCKPGSSCTGMQIQETIQNLFTPYMAEIARQFREGLFVPWVPFLQNLLLISNDFNLASQKLGSPFLGFKSRFKYATQTSCVELGSCDGPAVSSFFKQGRLTRVHLALTATNSILQ